MIKQPPTKDGHQSDPRLNGRHEGSSSESARTGSQLLRREEWERIAQTLGLSPRELQIVQCVFDDRSEQEIGEHLDLATSTAHSYLRRIYNKLDVHTRTAMVVRIFEAVMMEAAIRR